MADTAGALADVAAGFSSLHAARPTSRTAMHANDADRTTHDCFTRSSGFIFSPLLPRQHAQQDFEDLRQGNMSAFSRNRQAMSGPEKG
jgi:hypothetical protein